MRTLRFHPGNAPRKKFRGKRRYFRRVRRDAESFELEVGADAWWDLWHYHADWPGWGNRGWRYRRAHLQALCTIFQKICDARDRFAVKFQAWILLDGEDAGQDATFLHTPNANGKPFPLTPPDLEWGASPDLTDAVKSFLPGLELKFGWSRSSSEDEGSPTCRTALWIFAEGIGEPLVPVLDRDDR
jgi:hypothetical protein